MKKLLALSAVSAALCVASIGAFAQPAAGAPMVSHTTAKHHKHHHHHGHHKHHGKVAGSSAGR